MAASDLDMIDMGVGVGVEQVGRFDVSCVAKWNSGMRYNGGVSVKFNNKMKVYSSNRNHRKSFGLNESLRTNIESLSFMLKAQNTPSLSLSPSIQSLDGQGQALGLAKEFVGALNDPYRAMLLYPLILDSPYCYLADPLFQQTTFPNELHPLLSLHLHKVSGYAQLEKQGRRIIDVFYHYMALQAADTLQEWMQREGKGQSLGEWFYAECIVGFFQLLFRSKEDYTYFVTAFLREGISYLFLAAVSALKNCSPPDLNPKALQRIRVCFIEKYRLDCR